MARRPRGRPKGSKLLTPEVQRQIVEAITVGMPQRMAAPYVGIDRQAIYEWVKRGREAADMEARGEPVPEYAIPFLNLYREVERATAICARRNLLLIGRAAAGIENDDGDGFKVPPNWTAAAWLLERKFPEEFGRRERVELAGDQDKPVLVQTLAEFVKNAAQKEKTKD